MDAEIIKYENLLLKLREDISLVKELVHKTRQSVMFSYDADLMKKEFEKKSLAKMEEMLDSSLKDIRDVLPGNSKDATNNFDEGNENSILLAHPFTKNNVVLTAIFGFLNLDSIKNCRLANKTWKETSQLFFNKRGAVNFTRDMHPHRFFDDFDDNNKWNCGHYKFSNMFLSFTQAKRIFRRDFSTLTSLTLMNVDFENEDDLDIIDLSELLGDAKLKKLVVYNFYTSVKVIPLEKLSSVEHLELCGCKIVVNEDNGMRTHCCPKYLKLDHVLFETSRGKKIFEFLGKDLFDFSKASKIIIYSIDPNDEMQLNLESAKQKIDTVDLRRIELVPNKRLQITNLKFDCHAIDLSSLPDSLENLEFNGRLTNVVQSDAVSPLLPNLKSLCFSALDRPIEYLTKFSNCCKLKFVKLEKYGSQGCNLGAPLMECDISWLPQPVETLQLRGVSGIPGVATFRHLKNLIIEGCSRPPTHYMRPNFLVDNLYISFDYHEYWTATNLAITGHGGQSVLCRGMLIEPVFRKKLIVEGFNWKRERDFKTDPLRKIVDKMSICYSFEGDRGIAVSFIPPKLSPYDMEQSNQKLENKYFHRHIMEKIIK